MIKASSMPPAGGCARAPQAPSLRERKEGDALILNNAFRIIVAVEKRDRGRREACVYEEKPL
jgi:hypothetical protein